MSSLERWQYVYVAVSASVLGITLVSIPLVGSSVVVVLGLLVSAGTAVVCVRPTAYRFVMVLLGGVLLAFGGLFALGETSTTLVALCLLVGIGAVGRGVQYHRALATER